MEIKRKKELFVETRRRFIIRQSLANEKFVCKQCGGESLTAEQTAIVFQINQRQIFRIIEKDLVHFNETNSSKMTICLNSLSKALENKLLKSDEAEDIAEHNSS